MLRVSNFLRQRCSARFTKLYFANAAAAPQTQISKEALLELRKKTGYSFMNCRKALVEFGEDNMVEAEKWLHKLAAKEGWAKATKLVSRATSQGLSAVQSKDNFGAVLELNCETDFVAQSSEFKNLAEELIPALVKEAEKQNTDDSQLKRVDIDLEKLVTAKGRTAKEAIAMAIGKLGENITIANAFAVVGKKGTFISAHAHPNVSDPGAAVKVGRVVSLVGIDRSDNGSFPTAQLGQQLCQHVIGMNPESVGTPAEEKKSKEKEVDETKIEESDDPDAELNDFADVKTTNIDEDETLLLRQSFMLNPQQTVHDYLKSHGAQVAGFFRNEVGRK